MRIDPHGFTRDYLRGFETRLAGAPPAPGTEAAEAVAAAREQVEALSRTLDPAAPLPTLAAATREALKVGLKAALPGCTGMAGVALALAEDVLLGTAPAPGRPAPPRATSDTAAFLAAREAAHDENRTALRREGRETLLGLLAQAPLDERGERDRFYLQKASAQAAVREEEAADLRGAELLREYGFRADVAAAGLPAHYAAAQPGIPSAERRRLASDQASRVLGFTPVALPGTRQEVGDRLGALGRRLQERQVGDAEMPSAAAALRDLVASSDDPVVRRVAWTLLQPFGQWGELDGLALVHGRAEGARVLLGRVEDAMRGYNSAASTDYPVAEALTRVEPQSAATLAHFVHTIAARNTWKPEPLMEEWASGAASVLERWWAEGAVQVTRGGVPVAPGAVSLRTELASVRAAVRGTEIRLDPPAVEPTVEGLKAVQDASTLTQEALERGTLAWQWGTSDAHVQALERWAAADPSRLDPEFLRTQVEPMLNSSHYDLPGKTAAWLSRVLESRPDLVEPAMALITSAHPGIHLVPEKLELLQKATTAWGWQPPVDWLAARAYQPPTLHADSLFTGSGSPRAEFAYAVNALADRGAGDVEIPRPDGTMTDVRSAVLERVLADDYDVSPEKLFAALQKGTDPVVAALYRLVPPATVVDSMLERVAAGLEKAQYLMDLRGPELAALGVLAHASASEPGVIQRLRPLLDDVEGAMGQEVRDFLYAVRSLSVLEKGLVELDRAVGTDKARGLLDWADRSTTPEAARSRVLDTWAGAFRRDVPWGASVLEAIPDPQRGLDTVQYLETRRPDDPAAAWQVYAPMLAQAGDDETARKMFEAFGDMQAASVVLGGIEGAGGSVRIGGISLPVQPS